MKILDELERSVRFLEEFEGQWAICGGVAASIYRTRPRFTDDIDFVLIDDQNESAEGIASRVIQSLGYQEYRGYIPDPTTGKLVLSLLCARTRENERFIGIDFLLPKQPWIPLAVQLAQD